ncbi:MAG: hypothetical protein WDZ52_06010 [Pseudohongiellaceae bacterium]
MKRRINSLMIIVVFISNCTPAGSAISDFTAEMYSICTFDNEYSLQDWSNTTADIETLNAALEILDSSELSNSDMAFKGQCLTKLKEVSEAEDVVTRVLDQESNNLEALLISGRIALFQQKYGKAIDEFQSVIEINPYDFTSYYLLSIAYQNVSNIDASLEIIQFAVQQAESIFGASESGLVELRPDEELIYARYADLLFYLESDDEAAAALIHALDRNKLSEILFEKLYDHYIEMSMYQEIEVLRSEYCQFNLSEHCG